MRKLLFMGFAILLLGVSCNKEVQIEKNLWKKDGKWNIVKLTERYWDSTGNDETDVYVDCGTIQFNKDGSGVLTYSEKFTYTNTENKLTLLFDGEGMAFDLDWKKNKFTIVTQGQDTHDGVTDYFKTTLECEKR